MGATVIIAVSISNEPGQQNASGTLGVLQQTISIMQQSINSYELQSADFVIQPKLHQMGGADFKARSAAILAGEIATQEKMAQIKAAIGA
jgi:NTE family protein